MKNSFLALALTGFFAVVLIIWAGAVFVNQSDTALLYWSTVSATPAPASTPATTLGNTANPLTGTTQLGGNQSLAACEDNALQMLYTCDHECYRQWANNEITELEYHQCKGDAAEDNYPSSCKAQYTSQYNYCDLFYAPKHRPFWEDML